MAISFGSTEAKKISIGDTQIKKISIGDTLVYSAGDIVTYYVNTSVSYQEERDEGESCLDPKTFTPALSGWTFVGWRQDKEANGNVLQTLLMGDDPISLYAVFKQDVTLSYDPNGAQGSMPSETKQRYYNNGNITNPTFEVKTATFTYSGFKSTSWRLNNASSGQSYEPGSSLTLETSAVLYAIWTYVGDPYYYINDDSARVYQSWTIIGLQNNSTGYIGQVMTYNVGNRVHFDILKADDTASGKVKVRSGSIETRGNRTVSIRPYFAQDGPITIWVDGDEKVYERHNDAAQTWNITGKTSIVIEAEGTSYGYTGNDIEYGIFMVRFY